MTTSETIRLKSLELGFLHCGFARAEPLESLRPWYQEFIRQKRYAGLAYLERYAEQRLNPELVLPGVRTVIALLMNYFPPAVIPEKDNLIISKYAYGKDDHVVVKERLDQLAQFLTATFPRCRANCFYDSGMVLEKRWAQRCGTGWQGKNTVLINRTGGSFYHIGIILTDLDLPPDKPETDRCGKCELCIRACPTGALATPYQLDLDRCLAYHSIENKAEIPEEIRGKFQGRIFGCDTCQDVCPYNRFARPHAEQEFLPSSGLQSMRKKDWLSLTRQEFDTLFKNSCVRRTGFQALKRNINLAAELGEMTKISPDSPN